LLEIEQYVTLCGELRDLLLDQSQVSLVAGPRNHLYLLGKFGNVDRPNGAAFG
jgi:hypothetical protein